MNRETYFEDGLKQLGILIEKNQRQKMLQFMDLVLEKNKVMNLTAITEEKAFIELHLIDSLTILSLIETNEGNLIDVGTGAGFPGVIIKLARPELEVTLLDSQLKKLNFLKESAEMLGLNKINFVHARAEDAAKTKELRESFAFVTARAVAALPVLNELCLPFAEIGGVFAPMKGKYDSAETESGSRIGTALGAELKETKRMVLPYSAAERTVFVYQKIKNSPKEYPRNMKKIKSSS